MKLIGRVCTSITIFISLANVSLNQAQAAGFALIEHSASSMGNAFAGAAAIGENGSTLFFNPAGMSFLPNEQVVAAMHYISPNAQFSDNGSKTAPAVGASPLNGTDGDGGADALVPNFYYVKPLPDDIHLGVGVNVPFGLAVKYDDDWIGRYHAIESDLKTVNINPSVSYQMNDRLSIGYGLNIQSARIKLSSAIDFGSLCYGLLGSTACTAINVAPQQNDGFALLQGKDTWSMGWNAGIIYQPTEATRWGVSYRSAISHHFTGTADFSVPSSVAFVTNSGAFTDSDIRAKLRTPDILSISVVHQLSSRITIMSDYTWTGWSNFETLKIKYDNAAQPDSVTTENWKDSRRYAVGINYVSNSKLMLRGGLAFDQTPIPNSTRRTARLPGEGRTWLTIGANYRHNKSLSLDIAYAHLYIKDAKINNVVESESALAPVVAANLSGEYTGSVDIFSAQIVWRF